MERSRPRSDRGGFEGRPSGRYEPNRLTRRQFLRGGLEVGAAISLGGFLAACSSAPPGPNASPTRSTGKPVRGGSLVVGAGEGIPSDYFIGNMLGQQVFTFVQFAWPLFLQSPTSRTPRWPIPIRCRRTR
jgi:hypothetical protein